MHAKQACDRCAGTACSARSVRLVAAEAAAVPGEGLGKGGGGGGLAAAGKIPSSGPPDVTCTFK